MIDVKFSLKLLFILALKGVMHIGLESVCDSQSLQNKYSKKM